LWAVIDRYDQYIVEADDSTRGFMEPGTKAPGCAGDMGHIDDSGSGPASRQIEVVRLELLSIGAVVQKMDYFSGHAVINVESTDIPDIPAVQVAMHPRVFSQQGCSPIPGK
jgi:hypothetical protein